MPSNNPRAGGGHNRWFPKEPDYNAPDDLVLVSKMASEARLSNKVLRGILWKAKVPLYARLPFPLDGFARVGRRQRMMWHLYVSEAAVTDDVLSGLSGILMKGWTPPFIHLPSRRSMNFQKSEDEGSFGWENMIRIIEDYRTD